MHVFNLEHQYSRNCVPLSAFPFIYLGVSKRSSEELIMATVLPPPSKRQKIAVEEKARAQQDVETIPSGLGSVRVQFSNETNGQSIGTPISVPVVNATVKNLELLLNTLEGNVGTPSFHGWESFFSRASHPSLCLHTTNLSCKLLDCLVVVYKSWW